MSIKEIKINRFDGGLTENLRNTSSNRNWYTENVLLDSDLVSQTANNAVQNTAGYDKEYNIIKLLDKSGTLYGYGQDNVTNKDTTIYSKSYGTTNAWAAVTNGTITGSLMRLYDPFFVTYGGDLYFDGGNNYICKYSGTTMSATWLSFNSGMYGGVVWQGNMYGYQGQIVYKITTAPAVTAMITIPDGQSIVNMVGYGNYLAIVCTSTSNIAKMYLWDGITTTTFAEIVEIGIGDVSGGTILDGIIYVPMSLGNRRGFSIMAYSSGRFIPVYTYTGRYNRARTYNYAYLGSKPRTASGHMYFLVIGTRSDSTNTGIYEAQIFRYGKTNPEYQNSLSCWKTLNSVPLTGSQTPQSLGNDFVIYETAIGQAQPQMLAAVLYGMEGSYTSYYYEMTGTYNSTETANSSASAVIETPIFNDGNVNQKKNLKAVSLFYGNLGTGTAVLKYKKDNETTWTTIFTNGNETTTNHTTNVIESSGANLPQFNEIQYRIELSGNASLTGYKMKYETLTEENY